MSNRIIRQQIMDYFQQHPNSAMTSEILSDELNISEVIVQANLKFLCIHGHLKPSDDVSEGDIYILA